MYSICNSAMEILVPLISCFSSLPFLVFLVVCSQTLPNTVPVIVPHIVPDFIPEIHFENYNPKELLEKLPGYGTSWFYFPDGNGIPIIAKLDLHGSPRSNSPTEDFVTFHLYTRLNPNASDPLELGNISTIHESNFNFSNPTKFVVHGWTSSYESDTTQTIKDNLLELDDFNVILVDWEKLASYTIYPIAAMETKNVGDYFGQMVDFLVDNGASLDSFHLIGHSLGAHVVGRAGHSVKRGKVKRITGLDPALPAFDIIVPNEYKLDKSDAKFVDIIHTCGGILGIFPKVGHVDFYPNGGTPSQPGCFGVAQIIEGCSHGRAWQYFAESIKFTDGFVATQCGSWDKYKKGNCVNNTKTPMGIATPDSAKGMFFLRTQDKPPYILSFINEILNNTQTQTQTELSKLIPVLG